MCRSMLWAVTNSAILRGFRCLEAVHSAFCKMKLMLTLYGYRHLMKSRDGRYSHCAAHDKSNTAHILLQQATQTMVAQALSIVQDSHLELLCYNISTCSVMK